MKYLEDKTVDLSVLIENQFPQFVREDSSTFIKFIKSYYESQELKNQPLDIAKNLIDYYNISHFRKSELTESTDLSADVNEVNTSLTVKSTKGFPEKGYLKLNDEIIYYRSKTDTQFNGCVRGTSALILTSIPYSFVTLESSIAESHELGDKVFNVAYEYSSEFFRRIKTEIGVGIPETVVDELDISSFLTRVKSFYSAKGSLNSHKILFRILFNDKKVRFKLKERGSNTEIKIINFDGGIGNAQVVFGGSGYDFRKDSSNNLLNPPIVEIFGSGTGTLTNLGFSNTTAIIKVQNIESSGTGTNNSGLVGTIKEGSTIDPNYDGIVIEDKGSNYVGPITAIVRERDFGEEELVTSVSGNGIGIVESWDFNTRELTLKNVVGFFVNSDELVSSAGEKARGFVNSFEFISLDPEIEFPKDYLLKTSESDYRGRKISRIEVISGSFEETVNDTVVSPNFLTLVQEEDSIFGVKYASIESGDVLKIDNIGKPTYEIDIDINDDFKNLYLPASTVLTSSYNTNNSTITVDDATGFPVTNGIIYIDGVIVEYAERTANQFLNCVTSNQPASPITKNLGTEVISYGRYKTRREYKLNEYVEIGNERYYGENLYVAKTSGNTSTTDYPQHNIGTKTIGSIEWEYIGSSKLVYFLDAFVGTPEISATGKEGELKIIVNSARKLSVGQLVVGSGIASGARIRSINGKEVTLSLPNTSLINGSVIFSTAVVRVVGIADQIVVEEGGALFSDQYYEFKGKTYKDFTDVEYTSWDINSNFVLDSDSDFVGVGGVYDFKKDNSQHVYITSSAIPGYTTSKNRTLPNVFDGYTNAFTLGSLTAPVDEDSVFVFRNAVLQDSGVDYKIINNSISFTTIPRITESIYIRYFNVSNKVTKLAYTNTSSTEVTVNTSSSIDLSTDHLFISLNGVLQVGNSFTWDDTTKVITFSQSVSSTDDLLIFWIKNCTVLDSITSSSSLSYNLSESSTSYTSATTDGTIVAINGVIQKPSTSYTISGSTITFTEVNANATITVIDCLDSSGAGLISSDIQTLSGINLDRNNYKLQKLVRRIPYPSSVLNNNKLRTSKSLTPKSTEKTTGITIDGLQIMSTKGNTVKYGDVISLTISNPGKYEIPYNSQSEFLKSSYPKIKLLKNGGVSSDIVVSEDVLDIASGISKIDINNFKSSDLVNLQGFSIKPKVEVINNNPINVPNPLGFRQAIVDIGYKNGNIDNFIIVDSGYGYTEKPTIRISGGGKFTTYDIPFVNSENGEKIVLMEGSIIFKNTDSNKITLQNPLGSSFIQDPTVVVDNGSGALISVFVAAGKIVSTQINNSGENFWTEPEIIVNGIGKDAVLRPVLSNGQIVDVIIVNSGSGYTIPPAITVKSKATPALIEAELKTWTFNISNRFITAIDEYGGYVFDEQNGYNVKVDSFTTNSITTSNFNSNIVVGMEVIHPAIPVGTFVTDIASGPSTTIYLSTDALDTTDKTVLENQNVLIVQGDDRIRGSLKVAEVVSGNFPQSRLKYQYFQMTNTEKFETYHGIESTKHSKLIGWSYDGHPIYCKYGYTNPLDKNSGITEQTSSWRLVGFRTGGPSQDDYPLGSFIEDYEYVDGLGTLDVSNGRFCVTPEFPDGAYCYFMVDSYPHIMGPQYFSDPDCYNLDQLRSNDKIPSSFVRINDVNNQYYPEEIKLTNKTLLQTQYSAVGSVESIFIENAGTDYKVGDNIIFDNSDTGGSGVVAYVSSVDSPPISGVIIDNDEQKVEFEFTGPHNISKNDVVYIEYKKQSVQTQINLGSLQIAPINLNNKQLYSIPLELHKIYRLNLGGVSEFNISFDILNFNPYFQRNIEIGGSYVIIDPEKIPSTLYIHTPTSIYELKTEKAAILGRYVVSSATTSKFSIKTLTDITTIDLESIDFSIRSKGALGPIKTVNVVNGGDGYKILPGVTRVVSSTGSGAILQAESSNIGQLKKIRYSKYGDQLYGSRTVRNYLDLPITVKVKSNFEIENVDIISGGENYFLNPYFRVNGVSGIADFKLRFSVGELVDIEVLDGGSGFDNVPKLELFSQNGGSGATFNVNIRRKFIASGETVGVKNKSVSGKILNCDPRSSTLEILVNSGEFEIGDTILLPNGREYGEIISVNTPRAYAKQRSYGVQADKFTSSVGFVSDDYQKLEDNIYYQDWAYSLSNNRNTVEWRKEVNQNTHPSGFRLFGKNRIHSRKSLLGRSQNLVRSAVTFKASITSLIELDVATPLCNRQYIWFDSLPSPNPYQINDLVFGSQTEYVGRVIEVGENYIVVLLEGDDRFIIGEYIINLIRNITTNTSSSLPKTLLSINGILQEPGLSYNVSSENILPQFPIFPGDELVSYFLTTEYELLDGSGINNQNEINISKAGLQYSISDKDKCLVSLNGVIQRNTNFTLENNGKTIKFTNETLDQSNTFIIYHDKLTPLTFTGAAGTVFDLGVTPSTDCQLLIFFEGVNQSYLLTDYTLSGSTVTFSESVNPSEIFGWYIDESVNCEDLTINGLNQNRTTGTKIICNQEKNVTLKLFSDNVKKPLGFFELEKENLDGTLFVDGTTAYGFGSRFKYSNPEYSKSFVEVINDISYLFNGSTKTFNLTILNNDPYIPVDGTNSIMVIMNGSILMDNEYILNNDQITFVTAPLSTDKCSIRDYVGSYVANDSAKKGAELDQFNVFNGIRNRFNLSDNGVPETIANQADVFSVRNGILQKPNIHLNDGDSRSNPQIQSVSQNKITYLDAPQVGETMKLMSFNRQLVPENHRNWVLDRNEHFDGVRTTFTLLWSYDQPCDDLTGEDPRVESLVVVRNGVYQHPTVDYTLLAPTDPNEINDGTGSYRIVFVDPPKDYEDVFIMFTEDDSAVFQDRTDELTQVSSNVLGYATSVPNAAAMVPFVYVDGVYQDQTLYTWDDTAKTLSFSDPVDLSTQEVEFHAKLGTLNPQNVYTDILNAWLVVLQRSGNEVLVPTVTNTYDVITRSGSVTITGTDVVTVPQRSGAITIGSNNYRITNLDLNNNIMFDDPSNTFVAFSGVIQEPGVSYDHSGAGTDVSNTIGNGFLYDNMSIPMGVGYLENIDIVGFDEFTGRQRSADEINQVQDGIRTRYRLTLNGIKYTNYTANEDILVSINGVLQHPGVDYTLTGLVSGLKGCIEFTSAPTSSDVIWTVAMHDNELITLTAVSPQVYNTNRALTAEEQEALIIGQNGIVQFSGGRGYDFATTSQINFGVQTDSNWPQVPFGILTTSGKLLDYIDTPYNNNRVEFNMFLDEENFIPTGRFTNDSDPDPRSIFVSKNGSILRPISDYNLTGTIDSRIVFTTPPAPGDEIIIRSHGVVKEIDTIAGNGSTTYTLTDSGNTYYPDALIGRPRELENQIITIKNGKILDPLRDYYVFNQKVVFTTALTNSDSVRVLDYINSMSDIDVDSYSQQVQVGELIQIPGETELREVTAVHSPTVMEVTNPVGNVIPSGLVATPAVVNGKLDSITVTNGGLRYPRNMKFRTYGIGNSASANTTIDPVKGSLVNNIVTIDYEGWNIKSPTLVPTYESFVVRKTLLNSSDICFGTKLTSSVNDTDETLEVRGTSMAFGSNIQIQVVSSSGSNASFQPFVVGGKLTKVEVLNGGLGYNDLDIVVNVVDGGGSGAVLEPILDAFGTITQLQVINEGVGYDSYRAFLNNEVIEYTTKTSTELNGVTRGVLGNAASASVDDRVLFADCEQP